MAKIVPICYINENKEQKEYVVKKPLRLSIVSIIEKYAIEEDQVSEVVLHIDPKYKDIYQITLIDNGFSKEKPELDNFKSNLDFEGTITELHNQVRELTSSIEIRDIEVSDLEKEIDKLKRDL